MSETPPDKRLEGMMHKYDKRDLLAVYREFLHRSRLVDQGFPDALRWYESCKWDLDRLVEDEYDGAIPEEIKCQIL